MVYDRWGLRETEVKLVAPAAELEARLSEGTSRESFGSVHVQTDDASSVERAVAQYVPRMGQSEGTIVSEPRNGWVAVYDELCDRDPQALRRLGRELSDRMGAVVLTLGIEMVQSSLRALRLGGRRRVRLVAGVPRPYLLATSLPCGQSDGADG